MQQTLSYIRHALSKQYPKTEIEGFISILFKYLYHYSKHEMILYANQNLDGNEFPKIEKIVSRLLKQEPIQYILGETEFYNLTFEVTPEVLIPRNETEELVDLILKNHPNQHLTLLDIGTGSGCIPITLKKNRPEYEVHACDVSARALDVAKRNANQNRVEVNFFEFDVLRNLPLPFANMDIVVSNPPYVTEKEKQFMEPNVLENEPHLALFVPDDDPLLFYREISQKAAEKMISGNFLYFEINAHLGVEVCRLMEDFGFNVELYRDINDKNRMVRGVKI